MTPCAGATYVHHFREDSPLSSATFALRGYSDGLDVKVVSVACIEIRDCFSDRVVDGCLANRLAYWLRSSIDGDYEAGVAARQCMELAIQDRNFVEV